MYYHIFVSNTWTAPDKKEKKSKCTLHMTTIKDIKVVEVIGFQIRREEKGKYFEL
jgi:hypothetical protein